MPSTLLKPIAFLAFLLLAHARPQDQIRGGAFRIGAVNDWVSSGNYLIYSCGSQAPDVKRVLDLTYLTLQTAILSTDSPAYNAFFRSAAPASVTAVLDRISEGTNISTAYYGSRRPTVVCANALDDGIRTFWNICQGSEGTVVIQPPGTSIVFLCPSFFERAPLPLLADCSVVNHAHTRLLSHTYMAGTQYGFLVQALADMNIRETAQGRTARGGDVRDENACLALPPDLALVNPSSYAFYVSNVRAGCTNFPSRVPIQRDRELLALGDASTGNETAGLLITGCVGNGTNATSCPL